MNTCLQLLNNGVNSSDKGDTCNNAIKYKQIFSDANLDKAISGSYNTINPDTDKWPTCMFYVGPELPSLKEYAEIEAKYDKETNYGGRYIQIMWTGTAWHESVCADFYITRENLANKDFKDGKLNIKGEDMNGLASFADTNSHHEALVVQHLIYHYLLYIEL